MTILIALFIIGQLLAVTNARPAPQDLRTIQFDAFGPIDNSFDPFLNSAMDAEFPDLRQSQFDAFGPIDNTCDPCEHLLNSAINNLGEGQIDAFGPIDGTFDPYGNNDVILPKFSPLSRSGNEYFDSSSSFDIYNDLVYGPDFLTNNVPYFPGIGNPFGPMFPFAADISFDRLQYRPVINFAESLEDLVGVLPLPLAQFFGGFNPFHQGGFNPFHQGPFNQFRAPLPPLPPLPPLQPQAFHFQHTFFPNGNNGYGQAQQQNFNPFPQNIFKSFLPHAFNPFNMFHGNSNSTTPKEKNETQAGGFNLFNMFNNKGLNASEEHSYSIENSNFNESVQYGPGFYRTNVRANAFAGFPFFR